MRIDDRLLHAQVAVGWVGALSPDVVIVADDDAASTPGQAKLLGMGLPDNVELVVAKVGEAAGILKERALDTKKCILLVRDPLGALQILEAGLSVEWINVGGMHFGEGKTKLLPYVFVDGRDSEILQELAAGDVRLVAQDVPGNPSYDVVKLLRKGKLEED
ncbi:MAG: PTS sugar transporter subunit IIB [Candidatus Eisenbacteria bacterium]|nr:PTS sugar transporter subunit IIB [Candidatus Eisenbacteria bacterium]